MAALRQRQLPHVTGIIWLILLDLLTLFLIYLIVKSASIFGSCAKARGELPVKLLPMHCKIAWCVDKVIRGATSELRSSTFVGVNCYQRSSINKMGYDFNAHSIEKKGGSLKLCGQVNKNHKTS